MSFYIYIYVHLHPDPDLDLYPYIHICTKPIGAHPPCVERFGERHGGVSVGGGGCMNCPSMCIYLSLSIDLDQYLDMGVNLYTYI